MTSHSVRAGSGLRPPPTRTRAPRRPRAADGGVSIARSARRARDLGQVRLLAVGAGERARAARPTPPGCAPRGARRWSRCRGGGTRPPSRAIRRRGGALGEARDDGVGRRAALAGAQRVRGHARRLVDGDERRRRRAAPTAERADRRGRARPPATRARRGVVDLDGLPGERRVPLLADPSVDAHGAARRQPARGRDAQPGQRRGDEVIEPRAGTIRLDANARHAPLLLLAGRRRRRRSWRALPAWPRAAWPPRRRPSSCVVRGAPPASCSGLRAGLVALPAVRRDAVARPGRFSPRASSGAAHRHLARRVAGRRVDDDALPLVQLGVVREAVDAREVAGREAVAPPDLGQRVARLGGVKSRFFPRRAVSSSRNSSDPSVTTRTLAGSSSSTPTGSKSLRTKICSTIRGCSLAVGRGCSTR